MSSLSAPSLLLGAHEVRERRSVRHWIERDALKSLQLQQQQRQQQQQVGAVENGNSSTPVEIGPRKAIVVGFSTGWTAAGINLTFGRYTTNPYPSVTISDGKNECRAYLTAEAAQSSAFWSRPTLAVGSMIQMEKVEFVLESSLTTTPPTPPAPPTEATTNAEGGATVGKKPAPETYVLAVRGSVQNVERKQILDLNKSTKLKQWLVRKEAGVEPPEQPLEEARLESDHEGAEEKQQGVKYEEEVDDDDGSTSSSSADDSDSENSSSEEAVAAVAVDGLDQKQGGQLYTNAEPVKAVRRRKHKRMLIATGDPSPPRRPPAKKQKAGVGRGRPAKLSWEEKVGHMRAYKAEYHHCNAPVGYKSGNFALGSWINQLRMGKGSLSDEQKKELDDLGFIWDMAEHNWQRNFQSLVEFKNENGHTCVPISYKDPDAGNLGTWVYNQRRAKRAGKLPAERMKRLSNLGFEWDVRRGKRAA